MKKIFYIVCVLGLLSCNDGFLNRKPLDQEVEETMFQTYNGCQTYAWQFYSWFPGYGKDRNEFYDVYTDNGFNGAPNSENKYGWDKVTKANYTSTGSNGWNYSRIRTIQVMLDNLDTSSMTTFEKEHWKGICYFFKANEYFNLLSRFGQAIWIDHMLTDSDQDILYGPSMDRVTLADKILELLIYARDHVKETGDGANTITPDIVNALISRFGLFEGTWQKYHQVKGGDPRKYLQESLNASSALLPKYSIHSNYNEVFNSYNLSEVKEVLLYKVYIPNKGHNLMRIGGSSDSWQEASSDLVQSYLCQDGKPIWTSTQYEGNQQTGNDIMNIEFRNRDYRLYYSICPPYRVNTSQALLQWDSNYSITSQYEKTGENRDEEFIHVLEEINFNSSVKKFLPTLNWDCVIVREQPHIRGKYQNGQGFCISNAGYYPWKYFTPDNQTTLSDTDAPIFRMGEVLVNHAEAAWELGQFDQEVADKTINKLRIRAHVAPMEVNLINEEFDPTRDKGGYASVNDPVVGPNDYAVDPVLWEIRRERRVELYAEGFRFDDLRRWAKGHYISKTQYGAYVKKMDYENSRYVTNPDINNFNLPIIDDGIGGRICLFGIPNPGWLNKYYLYPIPLNDLALNKHLAQNPGYELQ
jgi:hypothetical protein